MRQVRRRGQALVEFALVFPFVLVTFLGIVDVAYLMFSQISLDAAASRAARTLAMNHPDTTRGLVYRQVTQDTPGLRLPNDGLVISRVVGPHGDPWVQVDVSTQVDALSAFYVTSGYRLTLRSRARQPLRVAPYEGRVHLP